MIRYFSLLICACLSVASLAQTRTNAPKPAIKNDGTAVLFRSVKTKLSADEKSYIYQKLGIKQARDKKSFVIEDMPVEVSVMPTDMNKDGTEEIFVRLVSAAVYGNVGETYMVFIKNAAGTYQYCEDLAGGPLMIANIKKPGYANIMIGGPGFEFPVYKWNGSKYVLLKRIKDSAIKDGEWLDIPGYSKTYTGG